MIEIEHLKKSFPSGFVLETGSLFIEDGERVALIGSNGSGKSTLLKLLTGQLKPDSGIVRTEGGSAGYSPQQPYVFKGSVRKNILLAADKHIDAEKVIRDCGLDELTEADALSLSGGERQRMFLARMLCTEHKRLFLDEPFSAVDIEYSEKLCKLLLSHCEESGCTLVFSTHVPAQALILATKVLIMHNGKVAEYSPVSALSEPESEFGKLFIRQWRI